MSNSLLGLKPPILFRTSNNKERWFIKYVTEFNGKGYILGTDIDTNNDNKVYLVGSFITKMINNKHFNINSLILVDEIKTKDGFSKPLSYLRNAKLPTFFRNDNILNLLNIDSILDDLWYNDSIRFSKLNGVYSPTIKTSSLVKIIDRIIRENITKFTVDKDGDYHLKYSGKVFNFTPEQFKIIEKKYSK